MKKIRIIKDWLPIKTIIIFCGIILTAIFLIFYLISSTSIYQIFFVFSPLLFFGVILLFLRISNNNKNEVQLFDDRIIIYKNKKQFKFKWQDVVNTSVKKLNFGMNSLIIDCLTLLLKPFYENYKIVFNGEQEIREFEFSISKAQLKKVQAKIIVQNKVFE